MLSELIELFEYNYNHIDFINVPVDLGFDCSHEIVYPFADWMELTVVRRKKTEKKQPTERSVNYVLIQ